MEFTHFDKEGNAAMVDVSAKDVTQRMAVAEGSITVSSECYEMSGELPGSPVSWEPRRHQN